MYFTTQIYQGDVTIDYSDPSLNRVVASSGLCLRASDDLLAFLVTGGFEARGFGAPLTGYFKDFGTWQLGL